MKNAKSSPHNILQSSPKLMHVKHDLRKNKIAVASTPQKR
jgi:hypothetical protein